MQIIVDVPDPLGGAGHAIAFLVNEQVDEDLAIALPHRIDDDSIPQIVRNPMNQLPPVTDQKGKLTTMLGGAFALSDNHCRVFKSVAIEIAVDISALVVHGMMEAAIPRHAMTVNQGDLFNDIRTVGEVGHVAEQLVCRNPGLVPEQENGAESETRNDANSSTPKSLQAHMKTGLSSIVLQRPSVHQACCFLGFFCFLFLSAGDLMANSAS